MTLANLPEVLTVEEAATVLRISRTSAYGQAHRWLATEGREGLPVVRIGRSLRVPRARLEQLLGAGESTPSAAVISVVGSAVEAAVAIPLVITASSRRVRAVLGPLAWAALETVALDADPDGDGTFRSATTVRKLAEQLEVNKDTAGRALARLIELGYLCRTEHHASRYMLTDAALELFGIAIAPESGRPLASDVGRESLACPVKADTSVSTVTRPHIADAVSARPQRTRHRPRQQRAAKTEQLTLIELGPDD